MIATCPSITQEILRYMAQRVQGIAALSQQQAKLISLGTLAAGLSHELNNPAPQQEELQYSYIKYFKLYHR